MYQSLLDIPLEAAATFSERISHKWREGTKVHTRTFSDLLYSVRLLTAAFKDIGIKKGDHVSFFMNNRYEWIVTDFALMALGAVSVPRGSDSGAKESSFIFRHSDSTFLILETGKQLIELKSVFEDKDWAQCEKILILEKCENGEFSQKEQEKIFYYPDLFERGVGLLEKEPDLLEKIAATLTRSDLLTIVYTSGTTGNPKGVMLTHANFLQNVSSNTPRLLLDPEKEEKIVVMLPSWHVYERAFEYCSFTSGIQIVYSSPGRFSADLLTEKPDLLITVPRIWESIYQKLVKALSETPPFKRDLVMAFIKINQTWMTSELYLKGCYISLKKRTFIKKTFSWLHHLIRFIILYPLHLLATRLFKPFREKVGGNMRLATCAAGALPKYLDEIFNALGIPIVNAYGMTECAPGITSRTFHRNTFGSTGIPFDKTEVELRLEDGSITGIGEKGLVFVRGPQVMLGYYKNPEATAAVLDSEGWLNTGDLAVRSENGEIVIVGRLKDTIVLMGGENVEPEPIEDKMKECVYIDHAVVIGQDQKQLSAIVAINDEELMRLAGELKLLPSEIKMQGKLSIENNVIYEILMKEVNALISKESGFKPFERISQLFIVFNDFTIGNELTQTLKVKRKYVEERFSQLVEHFFPGKK